MGKLWEVLSAHKRLWQLQWEVTELQEQLGALRAQNESMRQGMRRCVTCDYRIDFKRRQEQTTEGQQVRAVSPPDSEA